MADFDTARQKAAALSDDPAVIRALALILKGASETNLTESIATERAAIPFLTGDEARAARTAIDLANRLEKEEA